MPAIGKMLTPAEEVHLDRMGDFIDSVMEPESIPVTKYRLALSLEDVDRMVPEMRARLLHGKLDLTLIRVGPKSNVPAVAFSCDLLTAATICDIIRSEDRKAGDSPTGVWVLRKSWSRVSGNAVLTLVTDAGIKLNPDAFSEVPVSVLPPTSLPVRKV